MFANDESRNRALRRTADFASWGVTEVAAGVWRLAVPFPSPLVYSFAYLVRVDEGVIAIDLGWDSDDAWTVFRAGMDRAGCPWEQLQGVVITHAHPDHIGLARRVRATSNAWIAVHAAETPLIAHSPSDRRRRAEEISVWLAECGAPAEVRAALRVEEQEIIRHIPMLKPDAELQDGQILPGSSDSLTVLHTPGHTPGHVCVLDRVRRLVFTGDHVLPRVTPNVAKRPGSDADPLADFLGSVDRLHGLPVTAALPGHEWTFGDLDGRLSDLAQHHETRLDEVFAAVAAGAVTIWDVAAAVSWSRPFTSLNGRGLRSALGETHSHLEHLRTRGRIRLLNDRPLRWVA